LSFIEKKKNNQPVALVEEWLGSDATCSAGVEDLGMHLHPLTPHQENKKINLRHWEVFLWLRPFDPRQTKI